MNIRKWVAGLGAFAVTSVGFTFLGAPAQAADTSTTFTLSAAGGLTVSAPGSASITGGATDVGTLSGSLGTTTVSDLRGALAGSWTATVSSTDFTTGTASANETIVKANVAYWSGAATASSGTAVRVPGQVDALAKQSLSSSRTAFAATGTVGNNSTSWAPTLVVTVPAQAVVGTYSGTVTHSVA